MIHRARYVSFSESVCTTRPLSKFRVSFGVSFRRVFGRLYASSWRYFVAHRARWSQFASLGHLHDLESFLASLFGPSLDGSVHLRGTLSEEERPHWTLEAKFEA